MDAEPDSDVEQDLDQMLGTWLGELETMTKSIDADLGDSYQSKPAPLPPTQSTLGTLDNFSFSAFQLAQDQDVDLDALLNDLCKMENDLKQKMEESGGDSSTKKLSAPPPTFKPTPPPVETDAGDLPPPPPMPDEEEGGMMGDLPPPPPMNGEARMPPPPEDFPAPPPSDEDATTPVSPTPTLTPTPGAPESPMTPTTPTPRHTAPVPAPSVPAQKTVLHTQPPAPLDFSAANGSVKTLPNVSVTSPTTPSPSPMSPSGYASFGIPPDQLTQSVRVKLKDLESQLELDPSLSEEEKAAKLKSEKIKIALEKLKKARVQKLIVRVYMEDGSSKTMFVDETMRVRQVSHMLVEKNHLDERPDWTIIEQIPELLMERTLEDHEHLVTDVMLNWKRETTNRILFKERRDKYAIFKNPQNFLLSQHASEVATQFAEKSKQSLIEEFFNAGNRIPEIEGPLYLKQEGKKSWKKHYFVLRGSGLYYSPKGKSKSTKDIVCLVQFEHTNVYNGMGWKKKYKAPSDHCFALKHPQIQQKSKYIKYLCAEDYRTCQRWIAGLRLAKYNKVLLDNFNDTQREMTEYASSAESMSQSSSLTDTASLSSMQSSSSSQSSGSLPATHGSSPSNSITANLNAPLVLPQMTAQYRKSSMGNMFSNAWKRGQEVETHHQHSLHRERYSTRSSSLPSGRILDEEPALDNRPQLGNQTKANSGNTFDDLDVQKALNDLESEICASQPSNNPTPQPPPPTTQQQASSSSSPASKSITDNSNNSNALTRVQVVALHNNAISVTVADSAGARTSTASDEPIWQCQAPVRSSMRRSSDTQIGCRGTQGIIVSGRQRGGSLASACVKRVKFKEELEEKIPDNSPGFESEHDYSSPPPSPPSHPPPLLTTNPSSAKPIPNHSACSSSHLDCLSPQQHTTARSPSPPPPSFFTQCMAQTPSTSDSHTSYSQQLGAQTQSSDYHHPYTHTATATRAQQDDIVYGRPMTYAGGPENYHAQPQGNQEIVAKQQKLMELQQQQQELQQELQHQKLQLQKQLQQQQQEQLKQQLQHQQQLQQQRQERRQQEMQRQASERAYQQQQQQQVQRHMSMERSPPQQPMQRHVSFDTSTCRSPPSPQPQIQRHVSFERPQQQHQQQQQEPQVQRQTSVDRAQQGQNLRQANPVFLNELSNALKPRQPVPLPGNRHTMATTQPSQQPQQPKSPPRSPAHHSQHYQPQSNSSPSSSSPRHHYQSQQSHPPTSHQPVGQSYSQPSPQPHSQLQQSFSQPLSPKQHSPQHQSYHQQSPSHAHVNIRDKPPPSPKPTVANKVPPPMSPKPMSPRPSVAQKPVVPRPIVSPKPGAQVDRPFPMSPKPSPKPLPKPMPKPSHVNNVLPQGNAYPPNSYGMPMSPSNSSMSSTSTPSPSPSSSFRSPPFPSNNNAPPQKASRPPPPPKRSDTTRLSTVGSPTKAKKIPPPPPARTT
ncbi:homeobox protein prospero-like [Lytechinus pictus]|uniref:homeobox protein prospero-like n=1 Tax=Lytechinus pictus TaxID=7653 RepID=UPI0030B9E886